MLQLASLGVLSLKHHKLHFAVVYVCSHCCLAHRAACSLHQLPTLQWCSLALCTRWWTDWWELVDINCIGNYKKEIQEINLAFFFFPMYYFSFTEKLLSRILFFFFLNYSLPVRLKWKFHLKIKLSWSICSWSSLYTFPANFPCLPTAVCLWSICQKLDFLIFINAFKW